MIRPKRSGSGKWYSTHAPEIPRPWHAGMLRIESKSLPQRSATATHSGLLGRDGLDQLPNQRVFSASGVSDKTVGLAMCYQLANRFPRCY